MKLSRKRGANNQTGALGESLVAKFLMERKFTILEQNYTTPGGEIDIIAQRHDIIHFIEVKTVSHETKAELQQAVSRGTWRPEEQVHQKKLTRISRAIESWLLANEAAVITWQIDVCAVRMVPREKYATIKYLPNIIID